MRRHNGRHIRLVLHDHRMRTILERHRIRRRSAAHQMAHQMALHDRVLQRMERNRHQPTGFPQVMSGQQHSVVDFVQFVVDEDAQRLEGFGGQVRRTPDLVNRSEVVAEAGRNQVGQLLGGAQFTQRIAHIDDGSGNLLGVLLFAVDLEDSGEIRFVDARQDVGGRRLIGDALLVHAHVERTVFGDGKAAFRPIELHGRAAKVEEHSVDGARFDVVLCQQRREVCGGKY